VTFDCHTHWGLAWEDKHAGDPAHWLSTLDAHGVGKAVFMGHANLTRMDLCAQDNDNLARMAGRFPERLVPVGSSWPQLGDQGLFEARRCIESLGMKGLKFHPWLQGFSTADPTMARICDMAGSAGVPIFFHDGTPCYSLSEQIAGLARSFPRTQFVLAHAGLLWGWRSALTAARLANVWLCLCGPHLRAMELLCGAADPERLLWGSDFGFGFADQIEYRLNLFQRARISDALRRRILEDNPLRLFGMVP
jgi:uncharacterized protein